MKKRHVFIIVSLTVMLTATVCYVGYLLNSRPKLITFVGRDAGPSFYSMIDAADRQLWDACIAGDLKAVKRFYDKNGDVNKFTNAGNMSVLHIAAIGGNPALIEFLIDNGCYVNTKTQEGDTALNMAVKAQTTEAVRALLAKGADPKSKPCSQMHGAYEACNMKSPLFICCQNGNLEIAKLLVEFGAPVPDKTIPLVLTAAMCGKTNIVRFLLEHGADANESDNSLCHARGMKPYLDALGVNESDKGSTIALHYAASIGNVELVRLLVDSGSNPEQPDEVGRFALDNAIQADDKEMVLVLIKLGAKVRQRMMDEARSDDVKEVLELYLNP